MRRSNSPAGTIRTLTVTSDALADNMLGDSGTRLVPVYIPAGHDGTDIPLLVDLAGFTGSGLSHLGWKNFGENLPERLDRLIAGGMDPVCVALPDCFTRLGGNQYINSVAMGRWADYLTGDMLNAIESEIGCGGRGRRGLFGKSSGGYGAMIHAMQHADTWSAAACLSGDSAFEWGYLPDMPAALRTLAKHDSIEAFVRSIETADKVKGGDIHTLMTLAMAATYDPDPDAFCGIRLPVDMHDCTLDPDRWAAWLAHDPVRMIPNHTDALKSLKALWIECGTEDQYNLLYGARQMHAALDRAGVAHTYEEFPDNHSSLDYRLDRCLPVLATALAA
ncbi:MAG: alpha/beta hydrolase [Paracoccaceae bacterium]